MWQESLCTYSALFLQRHARVGSAATRHNVLIQPEPGWKCHTKGQFKRSSNTVLVILGCTWAFKVMLALSSNLQGHMDSSPNCSFPFTRGWEMYEAASASAARRMWQ